MKAISFTQTGSAEVLRWTDLPDPTPGPEEVIVRIEAVGVNFADIYRRRGEYPSEPPSPFVLGHEGAGVIHAVGNEVKNFSIGDRVAFAHVPRSNAELVKAPAWKVIPLPADISFETAASILLQGLTAHYLTHDSYKVRPGDKVLVHSASGGVGLLLLQITKALGAQTVGTVSSAGKVPVAKSAGADHVVVRGAGDWKRSVLEWSHGQGVMAAYDAIGSTLEETLSVVRPHGTTVYFGWAGGKPPKIDPAILMDDSKSLVGGELWSHIATNEALKNRSEQLFSWLREGVITTNISKRYHMSQAARAHQDLESGTTTGKILLVR